MQSKKLRYLDEDTNLEILEAVRVPACAALTAGFVHPLHHSLSANKKQFSIEQLLIKPFEEADDKEDHGHQKENAENRNEVECNCVLLL